MTNTTITDTVSSTTPTIIVAKQSVVLNLAFMTLAAVGAYTIGKVVGKALEAEKIKKSYNQK